MAIKSTVDHLQVDIHQILMEFNPDLDAIDYKLICDLILAKFILVG